MKSPKTVARIFGLFFILAFLSYGMGNGIIADLLSKDQALMLIRENEALYVLCYILMALVHSLVNIGLPVLMLPILKPFGKTLTYGYLSAGIVATVILIFGAIFLLLNIPLSSMALAAETGMQGNFELVSQLLVKGNFYAYQTGMTIWGIGGILFCSLLYRSQIVPRFFAIWGLMGYLIFGIGTLAELFGYEIGLLLSLPGGLFEITLSIWLILKGFKPQALQLS
ncbi:DUF4386 domain-containing protein [Croceimicrobium hydrocarbonivorans]|uniref:DUF4386 domain-containing protein n=1 Tax=Croceimicrobium hydrocarbonivorans TaxID=2761580 RepID=A0A7H0VHI6_9FLAO|nr:DUF4386 domain-containing protein [Croceimicrobium hydrocarbonivorans]QNR25184.1 DUF4386 domain-containing protein [Croceimicrobium hydrocarbonivorans]